MNYCIGDKFVLEIEDIYNGEFDGKKLYRMKGFNSLVFDDNGLKKLTKLEDKIEVGDVLESEIKPGVFVVVTNIEDGIFDGINYNGEGFTDRSISDWKKTGKYINVKDLLSQLERLK